MELTWKTFLIVCPLVFLAGLVDAIGGGGGLISLPAYLIAGVPSHMAIATNKLSSCCGTGLATARYIKSRMVDWKLAVPSVIAAVAGSSIGAHFSLMAGENVIRIITLCVLPVVAFLVLNPKIFPTEEAERSPLPARNLYIVVTVFALLIGFYDGFYGPGTGTFLIIAFTVVGRLSVRRANGQSKVINLTTNVTSLAVFFANGQVLLPLGLAAAACNMLGAWIGSGLVLTKGSRIVRPAILLVLVLLLLKILGVY